MTAKDYGCLSQTCTEIDPKCAHTHTHTHAHAYNNIVEPRLSNNSQAEQF